MDLTIAIDDPSRDDVRELLEIHLAFSLADTPPGFAYTLGPEQLGDPEITFLSARSKGTLLAVGALKRLDETNAELKSMHTRAAAWGRGVATAMVERLLELARAQGYERVSLETGTTEAFAPARALYRSAGFGPCEPFAGYVASPYNTFMTLSLRDRKG